MELLECQSAPELLHLGPPSMWEVLPSQPTLEFDLLEDSLFLAPCEQASSLGSGDQTNPQLSNPSAQKSQSSEQIIQINPSRLATVRPRSSKPFANRRRRSSSSGATPKGAGQASDSRWFKTRCKFDILNQQAMEKLNLAQALEAENAALLARSKVLEYSVQCRDFTLAASNRYEMLCGPGCSFPDTKEDQEPRVRHHEI